MTEDREPSGGRAGARPEAVVAELDAAVGLLGRLTEGGWHQPTGLGSWSVADLARHLAHAPGSVLDGLAGARAGRTLPVRSWLDERPVTGLLEGLRSLAEDLRVALDGLGAGELDQSWPPPGDGLALPGYTALGLALVEVGLHRYDLDAAFGRTTVLPIEVVVAAVEVLPSWLIFASSDLNHPPRPLGYRLVGDVIDVGFVFDGNGWAASIPPSPDCTILGNDSDLVLLLAGRRSAAQYEASDVPLAAELKRFLPGP